MQGKLPLTENHWLSNSYEILLYTHVASAWLRAGHGVGICNFFQPQSLEQEMFHIQSPWVGIDMHQPTYQIRYHVSKPDLFSSYAASLSFLEKIGSLIALGCEDGIPCLRRFTSRSLSQLSVALYHLLPSACDQAENCSNNQSYAVPTW